MEDSASSIAHWKQSLIYMMADAQRLVKEMYVCHLPQPKLTHFVGFHALEWSNGTFQRRQKSSKCLPLDLFRAVTPVDYFEFTTFNSSADWYVEHLHHQLHPNALHARDDATEKLRN